MMLTQRNLMVWGDMPKVLAVVRKCPMQHQPSMSPRLYEQIHVCSHGAVHVCNPGRDVASR